MKWLSGVLALCAFLSFPMTGCAKQPAHDDDVTSNMVDSGGTADVLHDADVSVDAIQFTNAADALTSTDVTTDGHAVTACVDQVSCAKETEVAHGRADVAAAPCSDDHSLAILQLRKQPLKPLPKKLQGVYARATSHATWRKFGRFAGADC